MRGVTFFMLLAPLIAAAPSPALPADPAATFEARPFQDQPAQPTHQRTITGRVAGMDGQTLWFPEHAVKVRLADIDSCELPQWAYDPKRHGERAIPKPVPCGAFAKAWLTRSIGAARVKCRITAQPGPTVLIGHCSAGSRDFVLDMIRAGWARVGTPSPSRPEYLAWQRHAMNARYGMWATYVLDMDEWRRKAVDTTLSRRPIADFNLLAERESEISPPFDDARRRPKRTDR